MQRISRAPVLSATLKRVSCWIIQRASSRPLQDLDEPPTLRPAERPPLHHAHLVPSVSLVPLVVGVERRRRAHDLAVDAVWPLYVDPNRDRLVSAIRNDDTLANPGPAAAGRGSLGRRRRLRCGRLAGTR